MKQVIGFYGKGSCGKSRTLYLLAKLLISNGATLSRSQKTLDFFSDALAKPKGPECDFRAVFKYGDQSIGITSWGDNEKEIQRNLKFLNEGDECDIVISASRSRGATTDSLFSLAEEKSAELIWAAKSYYADNNTHKPESPQFEKMNNVEAQFLFSLIQLN